MTHPLTDYRKEIDHIDQELVRLLDRRAEIARSVGEVKSGSGLNTFDPGRHKAVLQRAVDRGSGAFPREALQHIFREVLSACLNLQKRLRVGFLGPAATFAHQAAVREFGSSVDFDGSDKIREVFHGVQQGWNDYGVVPIENSTGGIIHDTLDAFIEYDCSICSEILLPIRHSLIGNIDLAKVKKVYSHPQAFLQCGAWMREHLPEAELIEVPSTVAGIQKAKRRKDSAAIGSDAAAEQNGMGVIEAGIEDNQDNTTRFLVIAMKDSRPSGHDKTSLMFSVKDRPGALLSLLRPFADEGINLMKIESRPTRKRAWELVFFVDLEGHRDDPTVQRAVNRLRETCQSLRILGSYPLEQPSQPSRTT